MSRGSSGVTLPERIELEYMLDQRRLFQQLEWFTIAAMSKFDRRNDAGVEELAAFLGLSVPQILDETKLRRRLRQIATSISDQKVKELAAVLGSGVRAPSPGKIEQWIDDQVNAIQATVERWLVAANEEIASARVAGPAAIAALPSIVRELRQSLSQQAEARASNAVLELNSAIIEEVARNGGSTHYQWETEQDDRVRPNHQTLHDTVQAWNSPPAGGGTKPGDVGHPGSGYGCRCVAIPLPGKATSILNAQK